MEGGSRPGERRGGRQNGAEQGDSGRARAAAHAGVRPSEGMAWRGMDSVTPVELLGRMFAELAGYVAPKRKSIEHTAEPGAVVSYVVCGKRECGSSKEWQALVGLLMTL